jgi:hypothetical protein
MMYERHKVVGVRKMRWDGLWHVMYHVRDFYTNKMSLTWDRVPKAEAMRVAASL